MSQRIERVAKAILSQKLLSILSIFCSNHPRRAHVFVYTRLNVVTRPAHWSAVWWAESRAMWARILLFHRFDVCFKVSLNVSISLALHGKQTKSFRPHVGRWRCFGDDHADNDVGDDYDDYRFEHIFCNYVECSHFNTRLGCVILDILMMRVLIYLRNDSVRMDDVAEPYPNSV